VNIFRRPRPSTTASASYERAKQDLEEQRRKHEEEAPIREGLRQALAENHLAELMYNALLGREP